MSYDIKCDLIKLTLIRISRPVYMRVGLPEKTSKVVIDCYEPKKLKFNFTKTSNRRIFRTLCCNIYKAYT